MKAPYPFYIESEIDIRPAATCIYQSAGADKKISFEVKYPHLAFESSAMVDADRTNCRRIALHAINNL